MRTARVRDCAAVGCRVIKSNPACHHLLWNDPTLVAIVLMEPERSCPRWLPDHVILIDTRTAPSHQLSTGTTDVGA